MKGVGKCAYLYREFIMKTIQSLSYLEKVSRISSNTERLCRSLFISSYYVYLETRNSPERGH